MKPFIIVQPQNPRSLDLEEIGPLLERFEQIDPDIDIRVSGENESKGYGVTWWEVLHIWLPASSPFVVAAGKVTWDKIQDKLADGVINGVTDWIKERHKKPNKAKRPVSTYIYGPKGEVLKEVEWQGPDFAPVEKDVKGHQPRLKRPTKMGVESMPPPIYYDPDPEGK